MIRLYLAGRYSSHPIMRERASILRELGFQITSRWITGEHESQEGRDHYESNKRFATEDIEDILASHAMVWFSEPTNEGRGGRHVEFGIALAKGTQIYVIGRRENVFHYYCDEFGDDIIMHFETWEKFIKFAQKTMIPAIL